MQDAFCLIHPLICMHRLLNKFLLFKIHNAFGRKIKFFACGGAKLSPESEIFLDKIGFSIIQGYGLTETAPVVTFNPINMDTQPYKSGPAYYDNFAAKSLAPSFNARQGGSINQGDIRYMTDEEIAEFVANGGQVEYLD